MPRAPMEARGDHSPGHEDAGAHEPGEHAWDRRGHGDDPIHAVWTRELYRIWGQQPRHPEQFLGKGEGRDPSDPTPHPRSPPPVSTTGGPPPPAISPGHRDGPSFPLAPPPTHQPPGLGGFAQLRLPGLPPPSTREFRGVSGFEPSSFSPVSSHPYIPLWVHSVQLASICF